MNIGGMGTLELIIVFLIAFIFLGPQRMSDAAKFLGKLVRDVRRVTVDLPELVLEEDDRGAARSPSTRRGRDPKPALPDRAGDESKPDQPEQGPPDQDGPVAFRPGSTPTPEDDDESAPTQDRP